MRRALLLIALLAAGCAAPGDDAQRLPDGVAVLGDSISRGVNVRGENFTELPIHSWATGNDPDDGVESHFERLRALDAALDIVPFNNARSGARADALRDQADATARQKAEYVLILIGANDACARTPIAEFRADVESGADALGDLDAQVLVASVPDVTRLYDLFAQNATARAVWDAFDVCPAALAPDADRAGIRALIEGYNDALRDVAAARGWRYDGGAVFDTTYEGGDVSTLDFFHPSLAGQAKLANATWAAGPYADWRAP